VELAAKLFDDGRRAVVLRLTYGRARLHVGLATDPFFFTDGDKSREYVHL